MTRRFGPTRGELRFRLIVSLGGLAFMVGALVWHEGAMGHAMSEVFILATLFFGGSVAHSLWHLRREGE
jgi:uncharacterized membrane protein